MTDHSAQSLTGVKEAKSPDEKIEKGAIVIYFRRRTKSSELSCVCNRCVVIRSPSFGYYLISRSDPASRRGMRCTMLHAGFHLCSSAADDTIRLCCQFEPHPTPLPTRLPLFFPLRPTSSHFAFLRPPPHPRPPHPPPAHLTSPHIIALTSPSPSPSPLPSSHLHIYSRQVATTRIQMQYQGGNARWPWAA